MAAIGISFESLSEIEMVLQKCLRIRAENGEITVRDLFKVSKRSLSAPLVPEQHWAWPVDIRRGVIRNLFYSPYLLEIPYKKTIS